MNAAFVSATTVVLVWQLPTIGESAGVDSFIVSYSLQEDSEENSTHTRHPSGEAMTHTVSYQQGRTPGVVISGLNSSALYNFTVSINYSSPVLLSAEASVTVHTDPLGKFNRLGVLLAHSITKLCVVHPHRFPTIQQYNSFPNCPAKCHCSYVASTWGWRVCNELCSGVYLSEQVGTADNKWQHHHFKQPNILQLHTSHPPAIF